MRDVSGSVSLAALFAIIPVSTWKGTINSTVSTGWLVVTEKSGFWNQFALHSHAINWATGLLCVVLLGSCCWSWRLIEVSMHDNRSHASQSSSKVPKEDKHTFEAMSMYQPWLCIWWMVQLVLSKVLCSHPRIAAGGTNSQQVAKAWTSILE